MSELAAFDDSAESVFGTLVPDMSVIPGGAVTEPDEAEVRRQLVEARVNEFNERVTGLDELPESLTGQQRQQFALHVVSLHDRVQAITSRQLSKRGEVMRLYLGGATEQEMAAGSGMKQTKEAREALYKFLRQNKLTSVVCSEALTNYAEDPEAELEEIFPIPDGIRNVQESLRGNLSDGTSRPKRSGPASRLPSPVAKKPKAEADEEDDDDWDETDRFFEGEVPTTDLVRAYLKEIGRVALLDAEQEVELAKRMEAGLFAGERLRLASIGELAIRKSSRLYKDYQWLEADGIRAKDHLLEANLRLVASIAKRYTGKGLPFLDVMQHGNLGLIRAAEKFDYTKGYKFSTYATWWIRQSITRGLADEGRTMRIPVHMVETINKVARVKKEMDEQLGREPTPEEIGLEMDMTPDRVLEVQRYGRELVSLDKTVGDDDDSKLQDFIEDVDAPQAEDIVDFRLLQRTLKTVLGTLTEREQHVVEALFGLVDGEPKTLDDVGRELGLSRERIRQIKQRALTRLKYPSRADKLKDFI